jgi:lactobin A/cerein 7B family class IIb bacteriocin
LLKTKKCLILKLEIMSLENLNLVELNAQEVQETEGGIIPLLIIGACLLFSGCAARKVEIEAQRHDSIHHP